MDRCGSCNRPLRDPRSIELGFGPGCWARLEHTERAAVRARLEVAEAASTRAPVSDGLGVAGTAPVPAPVPQPPGRSDSAVAVLASWTVGLLLAFGVVTLWRWVLLGLALVAVTALTGLLIEQIQERRPVVAPNLRPARTAPRAPREITATAKPRPVPARSA